MKKEKSIEKREEEFHKIARNIDNKYLSEFEKGFIELYVRADKDRRMKLFQALPETIETITSYWNN